MDEDKVVEDDDDDDWEDDDEEGEEEEKNEMVDDLAMEVDKLKKNAGEV